MLITRNTQYHYHPDHLFPEFLAKKVVFLYKEEDL
jgi:hypothetical protein